MGLLKKTHRNNAAARPRRAASRRLGWWSRLCRFEQMEPRQMLSVSVAPIQIGAVYFEDSSPYDQAGDLFEITWNGGAPGTQLAEVHIETDKLGDGLTIGDCFFDTAAGGRGAFGHTPFTIISQESIDSVSVEVADGGTTLVLRFTGFDPGEKFVFSIDVDEQGFLGPNAVAEGNEFEGSALYATFTAPHYYNAAGNDIFYDAYNFKLAGSGLDLPIDEYFPPSPFMPIGASPGPVYTAGAIFPIAQTPLPITLSGTVFEDPSLDNVQQAGEPGIAEVQLELYELVGTKYITTGRTTVTDADGNYQFTGLLPGTYSVVETQPTGYFSVGAKAGTVGGVTRGTVAGVDELVGITLYGGEDSIRNDFAEARPASISGRVFADMNGDCLYNPGEPLLAGVTIYLVDAGGNRIASTMTDSQGKYIFADLMPGIYGVDEIQPAGYLDCCDYIGSAGGYRAGNDMLRGANLGPGVNATSYDFAEVLPVSISGYVFQDGPTILLNAGDSLPDIPSLRDGTLTADDKRLPGVVLKLCDGSGIPLLDSSGNEIIAITNADGYYEFVNLHPGVYSIVQVQPDPYLPGLDTAGSHGGLVINRFEVIDPSVLSLYAVDPMGSAIVNVSLMPGDVAVQYNFSEVLVEYRPPEDPPENPDPPHFPPVIWPGPPSPPTLSPPIGLPFTEYRPVGNPYYLAPITVKQPIFGGSGGPGGYTWHLSVIDAGHPRREADGSEFALYPQNSLFDPVSWSGADLAQSQWVLADQDGNVIKTIRFGLSGAIPVTGDWDGSGVTKVGVFREGLWFLDVNGNGVWDETDLWSKLGKTGDQPVSGDWNGDIKTDIGIFGPAWIGDLKAVVVEPGLPDADNLPKPRPKNVPPDPAEAAVGWRTMKKGSSGRLRSDLIDHVFEYGTKGDRAITGDWNGDGIYTIGIYRNGVWFLDVDGDGRWSQSDVTIRFGQEGDLPVVGDWNGDHVSNLGVFRNGKFILDTNGNQQIDATDKVFELGGPGDLPVSGDWNGDGVDEVGVYQNGVVSDPTT